MKIDVNEIKKDLEELSKRDDEKGMQPELILGCFYGLFLKYKIEDDEFCKGCGLYWKCEFTLESYKVKEDYK